MLAALLIMQAGATLPSARVEQILARVGEEAEMLRYNASRALTEETLEQRAIKPQSRFRPRIGQTAIDPPKPQIHTREIISEYSVGSLRPDDTDHLMEFRQVVSVDGQTMQSRESARHALALGLRSAEDRQRKRMLEEFEHHGLVGAVTDFGILLLQFTRRGMRDLKLTPAGTTTIGPDTALAFRYEQTGGEAAVLDFQHRKATRHPLHGMLFARLSDGLPLRITADIHRTENNHIYDDQATVEYTMTAHGFVAPASVVHRGLVDGHLVIENHFRYAPFRRFGADAEIKFTEIPDPPPNTKP